ncbi:MAG TPA: DinB family protein [Puia sp.]|jgi:uncharacterized damage-inducible protein DinB|nr:DinB family protein [Puia sp.]
MLRSLIIFPLILLPPILFCQSPGKLFLDAAITKLQHSKIYTLQMGDKMPAEKYNFRPVPDEMSFAEQLMHLSENLAWLTSDYLEKQASPFTKADGKKQKKEEVLEVVNRVYDFAIRVLRNIDEAHLSDSVNFFAGPMNKLQIINLVSDHQTHHRGQLIVYLRLNGIKPPDYVGW